ncbi:hypothetical protein FBU31_002488 [Coemansia sp. 'formosensis']|nr:hypothetical protein FBU31_002488 [Coemansia sp. 'formosensis']
MAKFRRVIAERHVTVIERINNINDPTRLLEIYIQLKTYLDQYRRLTERGTTSIPTQVAANASMPAPTAVSSVSEIKAAIIREITDTFTPAMGSTLVPPNTTPTTAIPAAAPIAEQSPVVTANLSTIGEETLSTLPIAPATDLQSAKTSFSTIRSRRRYRYSGIERPKDRKQGE